MNSWWHLDTEAAARALDTDLASGLAPSAMVANFNGSVSATGASNIIIEGGSWVFDGQSAAGFPMAFVNGSNIIVRNTSVKTLNDVAATGATSATSAGGGAGPGGVAAEGSNSDAG